jgi:phosphate starvation-inducible PhoH-like protein
LTHIAANPADRPATSLSADKAVTLHFADNALLPLLLGDHDRHLVRIEQGLGVRLSCRGNRVAIIGEPARVEAAQSALSGLYRRLERGEGVSAGDVDTAIRMSEIDDPRLPLSDVPSIRTRRRSTSSNGTPRSKRAWGKTRPWKSAISALAASTCSARI